MLWKSLASALLAVLPVADAKTAWQQRKFDSAVPSTPKTAFNAESFKTKDDALAALAGALGKDASVTRSGDLRYGETISRVRNSPHHMELLTGMLILVDRYGRSKTKSSLMQSYSPPAPST